MALESCIDRLEEALGRLAEVQARTEERMGRLEEAMAALAAAQARTEERVDAGAPEAIDTARVSIADSGADALMIQDASMFSQHRRRILDFAFTHRLPTVCGGRQYAEAGCLIAYSPNHMEMFRRAASS